MREGIRNTVNLSCRTGTTHLDKSTEGNWEHGSDIDDDSQSTALESLRISPGRCWLFHLSARDDDRSTLPHTLVWIQQTWWHLQTCWKYHLTLIWRVLAMGEQESFDRSSKTQTPTSTTDYARPSTRNGSTSSTLADAPTKEELDESGHKKYRGYLWCIYVSSTLLVSRKCASWPRYITVTRAVLINDVRRSLSQTSVRRRTSCFSTEMKYPSSQEVWEPKFD